MGKQISRRAIEVRGARVHNLKDVSVDVPLNAFIALTGVSGSGKSSLAMGVLFAEGSRRYLDGLSTYQRRRVEQETAPDVDSIEHLPAAVALRQRPPVPGPRSTVGTLTEVYAVMRLSLSRLGMHLCPNGHPIPPTPKAIMTESMVCPTCHEQAPILGAESFAFTTLGACPVCKGLGVTRLVNEASLIPDDSLSIDRGAVAPWRLLGRTKQPLIIKELGVRTDIPWRDLSHKEKELVLHGADKKVFVSFLSSQGRVLEGNLNYENAVRSVELMAAANAREDGNSQTVDRFMYVSPCASCNGSRLNETARSSKLAGHPIAELSSWPLEKLHGTLPGILADAAKHDEALATFAQRLTKEFIKAVEPLIDLGLEYLSVNRGGDSLSTGERQRIQLAATALRRTTGMLYVLDEPTIGLHPSAIPGLLRIMSRIVDDGNSLVVVDHDLAVLRKAATLIELGPAAGVSGGTIVAQGSPVELAKDPNSIIGTYLSGSESIVVRQHVDATPDDLYISISINSLLNLNSVTATFPIGKLTVVTGVSGAGKTALVFDGLMASIHAQEHKLPLPDGVERLNLQGISRVIEVDATPIGNNARSTPATYSGVFDEIRKLYAATPTAKKRGWKPGRFSYNTPGGRCPTCEGLGQLSLDAQYFPDIPTVCPDCHGARYNSETLEIMIGGHTIADTLDLTISEALTELKAIAPARLMTILQSLNDVGLGYLTLGEPTPALSGGEAQRLRLASELHKVQKHSLFIFDEPTIGLHPRDVATLIHVINALLKNGATVITVEHDLDFIANADHIIDVGPGAGSDGGRIVASGSVEMIRHSKESSIGMWLDRHLRTFS